MVMTFGNVETKLNASRVNSDVTAGLTVTTVQTNEIVKKHAAKNYNSAELHFPSWLNV
jgi:hypothetical protein